jgi:hypothetical protein
VLVYGRKLTFVCLFFHFRPKRDSLDFFPNWHEDLSQSSKPESANGHLPDTSRFRNLHIYGFSKDGLIPVPKLG